jgi:uncharacterized protein YPO0396
LINQSLREIDYNTGRYILVVEQSLDQEVRQFILDLRGRTEGTLTGSEDSEYSEAMFLAVKGIIERFKGRTNTSEADKRWTRKVTDVRNWFVFLRLSAGAQIIASTSTTPTAAASPAGRRKSSRIRCWPQALPTSSASIGRTLARARSTLW